MRRVTRAVLVATVALVAVVAAPTAAGAAAVSATATAVGLDASGSCSDNPQGLTSGQGEGDDFGEFGNATMAGDPAEPVEIVASPLFDDWSFDEQSFGFSLPAAPGDGDLVAGYWVIGNPSLTVAAEWFVLWQCGSGPDSGTVLSSCFGPYGSCPQTVDEAMALGLVVSPTSTTPGSTLTLGVTGCYGGTVDVGLIPGTDPEAVPTITTGPIAQQAGGTSTTLLVPEITPPGDALVKAVCDLEGSEAAVVPIVVMAPVAPTTAPPTTATPTPVPVTPRFTG